jgi:hypothetical protein
MADIEDTRIAMNLMRRPGAYLIQTNRSHLSLHYIVPKGGSVSSLVAEKIKNHPQVKGDEDALWPGMSQVWRMR